MFYEICVDHQAYFQTAIRNGNNQISYTHLFDKGDVVLLVDPHVEVICYAFIHTPKETPVVATFAKLLLGDKFVYISIKDWDEFLKNSIELS